MADAPNKKFFTSRGRLILSLVPHAHLDSSDDEGEDQPLEIVDEKQLEERLNCFFDVLSEIGEEEIGEDETQGNDRQPIEQGSNLKDQIALQVTNQQTSHDQPQPCTSSCNDQLEFQREIRQKRKITTKPQVTRKRVKRDPKKLWRHKKKFRSVDYRILSNDNKNQDCFEMLEDKPVDYFFSFFTDEVINNIVYQSNLYGIQKYGVSPSLRAENIRDFLAIEILQGVCVMPSYLDYWSRNLHWDKIASIMPLKHYQKIGKKLHFADNSQTDDDRYFKIRPLMEAIRKRCVQLDGEEDKYAVDEAMVPYKGKKAGQLRHFMKDKPVRWGYKTVNF